jgi:hypothetical protein
MSDMKQSATPFLALAILLCSASISFAETDTINLYADPGYSVRQAFDTTPGLLKVYVVHEYTSGAVASSFRIAASPGFTGTWVSDSSPFTSILGTSQTGIYMSYGGCVFAPTLILEVTYALSGTSSTCSFLEVVNHPDQPFIMTPDCFADEPGPARGGKLIVNPNASCSTVATQPTTWGRVKSLYR